MLGCAGSKHVENPIQAPPKVLIDSADYQNSETSNSRSALVSSGFVFREPLPDESLPTANVPEGAEGNSVSLRATLSHTVYNRSEPERLLLKVDFFSPATPAVDRPPLNIALVLDHSSSMADDDKFRFAVEAARGVIENLSSRDIISLIAYNHKVVVLSPSGRVVNKPFLFHRLGEIEPKGFTDISAGLLEGISQIQTQVAPEQLKHVLILTDGKANRGIMRPVALRKIAKKALAKGIRISTLGVGADYDEDLLTVLADAGGGRYIYVRSPEQIPTAFHEELNGLLEVVAQNARLKVTVNPGSALITKVFGQVWEKPRPSYDLYLGNLRAGERGVLLLAFKPEDFTSGGNIDITTRLTFDDPQIAERVQQVVSVQSSFTPDGNEEKSPGNKGILLYGEILDGLELAVEGLEGFDEDRHQKAQANFAESFRRARSYALETRNQDLLNQTFLLKHFLDELQAAKDEGKMHGHLETRKKLKKESDYQRYLLLHHRAR